MEGENSRSAVPNLSFQFSKGLRVLVADDDRVCLAIVQATLIRAGYVVMICTDGAQALSLLRERKGSFDIVLLDVHMPGYSGLQVLEIIGRELDIPAVLISSDRSEATIMEGIRLGACGHILKPFQREQLEMIWQYVIRKQFASAKKNKGTGKNIAHSTSRPNLMKKPRAKWSNEMHQDFVKVVKILGIDRAAPKKILELMEIETSLTLTRHQVASHLQKFRLYLKQIGLLTKKEFNAVPLEVLLDPQLLAFCRGNSWRANNRNSVTQNPTLRVHVPNSGTYQNPFPMLATNTLFFQAQPINVQSAAAAAAAEGTSERIESVEWIAGTSESIESVEWIVSDEDEILREDNLQALFNSNNEDGFMPF